MVTPLYHTYILSRKDLKSQHSISSLPTIMYMQFTDYRGVQRSTVFPIKNRIETDNIIETDFHLFAFTYSYVNF